MGQTWCGGVIGSGERIGGLRCRRIAGAPLQEA